MTLLERNVFFKAGIAFCTVITFLTAVVSFVLIPFYSQMEGISRRPSYLFQIISGWFLGNDYLAVHVSLILAILFSFTGMIFIYSYFLRTSTPEILYISFFTFSFSFEIIRFILPLHLIYTFPVFYLLGASKVLLFARYFGIFSLFIASVCAAGFEIQKTRNIIFILIISTLLVILGIPVDTQTWDTSFIFASGYTSIYRMIEAAVFIACTATFLVAVKVRDSREYTNVAIGVVFALAGRNIILGTDNWAGPVTGIILLSFGTWFICFKIHKIHLWL
ncbi:MAG: hypothetical protein FWC19_03260 [Treponema sp.]|nr:hypothetical protein [Treponema sp.]MCL2271809.1 hypothetical protein [Treponema sp.]